MEDDYVLVNYENYDRTILPKTKNRNMKTDSSTFLKINTQSISTFHFFLYNFLKFNKFFIFLDFKKYFSDILKSYKNNKDIFNQFNIDSKRIKYIINGHKILDTELLLYYLTYKFQNDDIYSILLLCTQAVMALPIELLQNNIILQEYYIFELTQVKEKELTICIDIPSNYDLSKNIISFKIYKKLRIVKFINTLPVDLFFVNFILDFDIYIYNKKLTFPEYMLLYVLTERKH